MRYIEFVNEDLEEGWRQKVGAAAAIAGLGLGMQNMIAPSEPSQDWIASHQLPKPLRPLNQIENLIASTAKTAGIQGHELAQVLAQAAHETGNFMAMEEQGDKKYLMDRYWYNVPMRKALGNIHPSDAIRYKGRGFIQITGRGNYARMSKLINVDLLNHPEYAARKDIAAKILVQYFKDRIEPTVKDFSKTHDVTKKINPHDKPDSTKDRDDKFQQYKNLLALR